MTQTAPWTIKRLLDWTADFFKEHQAEQPRLDAEVLLAEAIGCTRIDLYTQFDQEATEAQRRTFRDWVKRRAAGEPVAYLVGKKEFFSLMFEVTPDVLIPRPETEHLVVEVLDLVKVHFADCHPVRLVDVGTGSGNIPIALASHLSEADLTAIDISSAALQVAQNNAVAHGVAERIQFVESDLFASLPDECRFEIVVSNPPYIGQSERAELDCQVKDYEPEIALFSSGETGHEIIARLVQQAAHRLVPGGFLVFEISPQISAPCLELMEGTPEFESFEIKKDLAGLDRFIVARTAIVP